MIDLEQLMQEITVLTPFSVGVVALAGLVVGIAPSSFPLISVAAGLAAGKSSAADGGRRLEGLWRSAGFALGIVTVDAVLGALFGIAGFAVLRVLVHYLALAYALLAVALFAAALALLRVIHIVIPVLTPSPKLTRTFFDSYLLGLPFGLSTCPACTPLLLPVVAVAAGTTSPLLGAVFMATFGLARSIPIVVAGAVTGSLVNLRHTRQLTRWVERGGGVLMLGAAAYFAYQAAFCAGWL
ncbi:cytochrome c biogenesis protein CcdA [Mesorhizobium sp.]|uniref:cytochrome c biogenesis CcdA family protein n=1 Tax=Mesorhizobium sp. TaxID=1871066 RepID=UPI00121A71E3|nr:cytochrome c biogenesis protein CcdA [Mesorhizobium sp.]TIS89822.1 MAG: cytochrome C biogenesis protein [Mesorhizobium sp.]